MPIPVSGQVGPQAIFDGVTTQPLRQGRLGEVVVTELHGRFYEQAYRNNMFSGAMVLTSISNATFTTATANSATLATAATATPIAGLYNPLNSGVNAVVLQATVNLINTALQETGPGGLVYVGYTGNSAITTGSTPFNRKTLLAAGSQCKFLGGVALTGLVATSTTPFGAVGVGGPISNLSTLQTAAGLIPSQAPLVDNVDGSIIVPPGGVLGIFCSTTPVAWSAVSDLLWEEVPI